MDTVKEMLDLKGRGIWSIEASQSVYQAIKKMAEMEVGALTVLDGDSRLAGIVSERDYARKVILKNKSSRETHIAEVMTTEVVSVDEETSVEQCLSLMDQNKIRHLPVIDGQTLVGMITVGDLLKFRIKKQSVAIEELEGFIMEEQGGEG
jgi:CBS domain-containing protein